MTHQTPRLPNCPDWCGSPHATPGSVSHVRTTGPSAEVWVYALRTDKGNGHRDEIGLYHFRTGQAFDDVVVLSQWDASKLARMLDALAAEGITPGELAESIRKALGLLAGQRVASDTSPR